MRILPVITVLCVVFCVLPGCIGGGKDAGRMPALPGETELPVAVPYEESPPSQFPSPSSLPTPDGVDSYVWQQLTSELERQLISLRKATRVGDSIVVRSVSTPPLNERSKTVLSATATELHWGYYSNGDYDQNGEVNVADLTPIAIHFMETNVPFQFPVNSIQAVIDGDGNGEINLADVTQIAINFQTNVAEYNVYRSKDAGDYPDAPDDDNGGAEMYASLTLSAATGNPADARLQFSSSLPESYQDDYFWVRPEDNEATEGIASNRLGSLSNSYSLNGHIYMAGGGTDPLPGVPVELSGDATASTVTNEFGQYSFDVQNGDYTITPTGDPYGYTPLNIDATVTNADKYLSPIYPSPVDIVRRWTIEEGYGGWGFGDLKIDDDDNIFIWNTVGYVGDYRHYLLKYDMFGELIWVRVYDMPYSALTAEIYLLPSGGMYLAGTYRTTEEFDSNGADLFVMKLDSSGNIIWDLAFNYPTSDLIDHWDAAICGYVDDAENLHFSGRTNRGPEEPGYMLTINPDGELIEQVHYEPNSVVHDSVNISDFEIDPLGGLFASGSYSAEDPVTGNFIVRMDSSGELDWINNCEEDSIDLANIEIGLDGNIYTKFDGHATGNIDERGIQLSRLDSNGVLDWEVLCTTEFNLSNSSRFVVGPMGKLWIVGDESGELTQFTNFRFPYVWSFQPDGAMRFSRQWICDGYDIDHSNTTTVSGMEINQFGVVFVTGAAEADTGEWVDHAVTIQDTNWPITHEDIFSMVTDEPAPLRDLSVSEIPDVGVVDPEPAIMWNTFIMLYRP